MYTHREIHIFRLSFCNSPSTQTLYKSCQVHLISALPSNMEEARSISLGLIVRGGEEEEGHPLIGPTDLPNQMELEVVTTFHQGLHLCFTEKELMRCTKLSSVLSLCSKQRAHIFGSWFLSSKHRILCG